MKLNLGCGRIPLEGYVNIDKANGSLHPEIMCLDLDRPGHWTFPEDIKEVTEVRMNHVIEHIANPLNLMQALWEVAAINCICVITCPYGSSDDADEDPTHTRRYFKGSWGYFSQPYYWRADYGYRGDWQPITVALRPTQLYRGMHPGALHNAVNSDRNVIEEMTVTLWAVKPRREPLRALQVYPKVVFT